MSLLGEHCGGQEAKGANDLVLPQAVAGVCGRVDGADVPKLAYLSESAAAVSAGHPAAGDAEDGADVNPPSTNRGGLLTKRALEDIKGVLRLRIDWLTASYDVSDVRPKSRRGCGIDLVETLEVMFGEADQISDWKLEAGEVGGAWLFRDGASLRWDTRSDRYILTVPGTACGTLGAWQQLGLLQIVVNGGGKVTRLDVALDDGQQRLILADIYGAAERQEVTGFRKWAPQYPDNVVGQKAVLLGVTFGKRGKLGGLKQVIFYDKGAETGLAEPGQWVRCEARYFKEKAVEWAAELAKCQSVLQFIKMLASAVASAIDFRANTSTHVDRRARLEWWAKTVLQLGAELVEFSSGQKSKTDAAKTLSHFYKQGVPGLKAMERMLGQEQTMLVLSVMISHRDPGSRPNSRAESFHALGGGGVAEVLGELFREKGIAVTYSEEAGLGFDVLPAADSLPDADFSDVVGEAIPV